MAPNKSNHTIVTHSAARRVDRGGDDEAVLAGGDHDLVGDGDDAVHGPAVLPVHHLDAALAAVVAPEEPVLALHQLAEVPSGMKSCWPWFNIFSPATPGFLRVYVSNRAPAPGVRTCSFGKIHLNEHKFVIIPFLMSGIIQTGMTNAAAQNYEINLTRKAKLTVLKSIVDVPIFLLSRITF